MKAKPSDLSFHVRMDRQGVVHRWMVQSSLCDPDYHVLVVFTQRLGWFREGEELPITCMKCIALEAERVRR